MKDKKIKNSEMVEMIIRHSYTDLLREFSSIEMRGYRDKLKETEIFEQKMDFQDNLAREISKKVIKLLKEMKIK